jgi:hypothetical protein
MKELDASQLELIRIKLGSLKKEKAEHLCRSIKFSTKLMTKILSSIEHVKIPDKDVLLKIKVFLKVTRLVVEQAKTALSECKSEKETEFFSMYFYFI